MLTGHHLGRTASLRNQRRYRKKTKVVVITSYFDTDERLEVQRAGAADYLIKDLDTGALVQRLTALSKRRTGSKVNGTTGGQMTARREFASNMSEGKIPAATYSRVLVPLDGSGFSEQVLPHAMKLAGALGADINLIRIYHNAESDWAHPTHGLFLDQIDAGIRSDITDYLHSVQKSVENIPCPYSGDMTCLTDGGDPASGIVEEAKKVPGTLVAMSTHGRSGVGRWLMGSVTDRVLHATGTPLLIFRSQPGENTAPDTDFQRVIVPLDGSVLAEESLPHLKALAQGLKITAVLVRVTGDGDEAQCRTYLSDVADNLKQQGLENIEELVLDGHAAEAIIDIARETPNNLVVMTTRGRSGVKRWMLGSVTDRVVKYSGVPVLVIPSAD
jgi:nucleotide-binding universal stress UspA family protein